MNYGIKLHVWGEAACFSRPEMKVERVSYDVMTPSAARGIIEAIHWKPAIRWVIDTIEVLKPIQFQSLRRNEVASKVSARNVGTAMKNRSTDGLYQLTDAGKERQQRAATILCHVGYVIEAHFELTDKAGPGDNEGKHLDMFRRRARNGQCYHRPYFGTREFPVDFELVEGSPPMSSLPPEQANRELGWMLHDIDFANQCTPKFYRATMQEGVIRVPQFESQDVLS